MAGDQPWTARFLLCDTQSDQFPAITETIGRAFSMSEGARLFSLIQGRQ